MATTKYKISEEILRLLKGNPVISGRVHINDVKILVEQTANQILKADLFSVNMADGDSIPSNCMIYTYENVPVVDYKNTSACVLPSIPISLPRNMGVFQITKTDDVESPFIPIPSGVYGVVKPQALLGELSGLIGYEVFGSKVVFTKDLIALGITAVDIRLVGVDMSTLGDYDILPLSADMEAQIVTTVYGILVQTPPADKAKNNTTD